MPRSARSKVEPGVAGMLPIALGFGADASFRRPMALAAIGGLMTSTALSLLVVPVAFSCIHGLERVTSDRERFL